MGHTRTVRCTCCSRGRSAPIRASRLRREGRWVAFKPILENFTDALTPLTVDIVRRVLPRFGQFIDGRYYLNFDSLRRWYRSRHRSRTRGTRAAQERTQRLPPQLGAPECDRWASRGRVSVDRSAVGPQPAHAVRHARGFPQALRRDARQLRDSTPWRRCANSCWVRIRSPRRRSFRFRSTSPRRATSFCLPRLRWYLRRFAPTFDLAQIAPLCAGTRDMLSTRLIDELRADGAGGRNRRRRFASCCSPIVWRSCRISWRCIPAARHSLRRSKRSSPTTVTAARARWNSPRRAGGKIRRRCSS